MNNETELLSKYIERSKKFNIFKVLGLQDYEIRHSNFLAWLLNPKESHNLGDTFLKKFLNDFLIDTSLNSSNINISTEYSTYKNRRIDILITGDNFVCVIKNKYGSSEHDNQCKTYKKYVEKDFGNIKKIFIFLDVNKNSKKTNGYTKYNYKDNVLPILKEIQNEGHISQPDILNQYITVLEEQYAMFNGKLLPNINDKIEFLRKIVKKDLKDLKDFECSNISNKNDRSQKKPFALEIKPVENCPKVKDEKTCCMLYYWITFENNGLFFNIILREPNVEHEKKVTEICKLLNINNNITKKETVVK